MHSIFRYIWLSYVIFLSNLVFADGLLEVKSAFYPKNNPYDDKHITYDIHLSYEYHMQLSDNSHLLINPSFSFDMENLVLDDISWHETSDNRATFTIEELTFSHYFESFEFNIGKQVFSWGLADLYNPSDHLNAVDTLEPLDTKKLGQWSTSLLYLGDKFNFHTIYIPRKTASRLPKKDNRWFLSVEEIQIAASSQLGFTPEIDLTRKVDHHSPTVGIQLMSGQIFNGWDIEFSFLHSQDATGVYLPELMGEQLDLVRLFPHYNEMSLGFSTAVDEYTFHGVSSYRNTLDNKQDDDYITFLLGGRRTFYMADYDVMLTLESIEEVTLVTEYVREKITHNRDEMSNYINSGFGRTLIDSLLINLELKFSEYTHLNLGLVKNFDKQNHYISIEFSHQLTDEVKINTGFDFLNGDPDSLFGQWSVNDRIFINTSYHF